MNKELVSVMVLAYNAEKYITDLLESIKMQTYQRLELVVSDDASTDNTVKIVEEWCKNNKERFENVIVRKSKDNQGVTKNVNLGYRECNGKYIKLIAADDKLVEDCIEAMVSKAEEEACNVLFGKIEAFGTNIIKHEYPVNYKFYQMTAREQYKQLLAVNEVAAPTVFIRKSILVKNGYCDERFPFMEDYPLWLKLTKNGEQLKLLDKIVVNYRRTEDSLTTTTGKTIVGKKYFRTYKRFFYQEKLLPMIQYKQYREIARELKEFLYKDLLLLTGNKQGSKVSIKLKNLFYS